MSSERSPANAAQTRAIAEQVAETAIAKFAEKHPEVRRGTVVAEIPPPLKWAAIIASSVITVSASAGLLWLVSSVSEMNLTLARMDERMVGYMENQERTAAALEARVQRLEGYHRSGVSR
ncbi:hypothetical protein [Allopontixanthobacter sediminis]|uniref:Uncharacterized protein n=1 Tax=Allopontixanthobacter sediminis TaxID=1689985 RepID=A0A845AXM2_9SPHN|nr:hypothetical protein [Allopontixanthobacter sediminis]MXP43000.1 hypothetical protein [Allopontixanthobacter sediminis]